MGIITTNTLRLTCLRGWLFGVAAPEPRGQQALPPQWLPLQPIICVCACVGVFVCPSLIYSGNLGARHSDGGNSQWQSELQLMARDLGAFTTNQISDVKRRGRDRRRYKTDAHTMINTHTETNKLCIHLHMCTGGSIRCCVDFYRSAVD